jgi:hypothetical protein
MGGYHVKDDKENSFNQIRIIFISQAVVRHLY